MNAKLAICVLLGVSFTCGSMFDTSASGAEPLTRGFLVAGAYVPPSVFVDSNLLPFYSLYPPVYYSHPVRRPYGFTPFAWRPCTYGPGAYYSGGPALGRAPASVPKPLRIINRYARPAKSSAITPATTTARQPAVIHPTALAGLSE